MTGSRRSHDSYPLSEINITPLVDVMLVLLVIFMVTTPLMENGIPLDLPKTSSRSFNQAEMPTTLSLTRSFQIFLNRDEIPRPELASRLETFFKKKTKKELFIRADGSLPYRFVAETMATVKNAGIYRIGLVTEPQKNHE